MILMILVGFIGYSVAIENTERVFKDSLSRAVAAKRILFGALASASLMLITSVFSVGTLIICTSTLVKYWSKEPQNSKISKVLTTPHDVCIKVGGFVQRFAAYVFNGVKSLWKNLCQ